jgi:hypothetical protein
MLEVAPAGVPVVSSGTADLHLAPNPNNGSFKVHGQMGAINGTVSYRVTNVIGQEIFSGEQNVTNGVLDTELTMPADAASGMYLLQVNSGKYNYVARFEVRK